MNAKRRHPRQAIGVVLGGVALFALAATSHAGPVPLEGPRTPPAIIGEVQQEVLPVDDDTTSPDEDASAGGESAADGAARSDAGPPADRGRPAWAGSPGRAGAGESEEADDGGRPPWAGAAKDLAEVTCEAARNHGQYVSYVARTTPPGPDKDRIVTAAAESDCGKPPRGESEG